MVPEYELLNDYKNDLTPLKLKHNICGSIYESTTRKNFVKNGVRCPICYENKRPKHSKYEKRLISLLKENSIEYHYDYEFSGENTKTFKFDFFIPSRDLVIEVDGNQHFRPWKGKNITDPDLIKLYSRTVNNDKIKNEIMKRKNGLLFIRIKSDCGFKNFDDILNSIFIKNDFSSTTIEKYSKYLMMIKDGIFENHDNYYASRVEPSVLG